MTLTDSSILNNLLIPGLLMPDNEFEKNYIACRSREKRIYTDEEVKQLPSCDRHHPHYGEWLLRKSSANNLVRYLQKKEKQLTILEIGCGNGWLCNTLSSLSRSRVTGMDINFTELQQAARVFNDCRKLKFIYGDIRRGALDEKRFDVIVFAASIQYFPDSDAILELCFQHLLPKGEIHIIDSCFYRSAAEALLARQRTEAYYSALGFPEMADHYFHHELSLLAPFNRTVLYNPSGWKNKLLRNPNPFHWIRIKNDEHA